MRTILLALSLMIMSTINAQDMKSVVLKELHPADKSLSTSKIFTANQTNVISIQLLADGKLDKHLTKTPAMLICISGKVTFQDEKDNDITLSSGESFAIEPNVYHWVLGVEDSQLILIK